MSSDILLLIALYKLKLDFDVYVWLDYYEDACNMQSLRISSWFQLYWTSPATIPALPRFRFQSLQIDDGLLHICITLRVAYVRDFIVLLS